MDTVINFITNNAGQIALWLVFFTKLANLTPTQWDNKALDIISKALYTVFSVLGAKVPDIEAVKNGKIITASEADAKEAVQNKGK